MVTQHVIATITPPFPLCAELTWLLTPEMKVVPFPTTESHLSSPRQECTPLSQCYWGHKACSKLTEERGKPLLSAASKSFIHISNVASPLLRLQLDAELTQGRQSRWKHSIPSYSPLFCFLLWCPLPFETVSHRQRDGAISLSLLLISNRFTKLNRRKGKRSTWIHWYKHLLHLQVCHNTGGEQRHRTPQRDFASKILQNYRASKSSQIHTTRWKIPYLCITASATVTADWKRQL